MHVAHLAVYPLKSAAGISLPQATATPLGLQWDRRWMLVDAAGTFISQRQQARMALIRVQVQQGVLCCAAPGMPDLVATPQQPQPLPVMVWQDRVLAETVSAAADAWFSRFLGVPARLVHFPENTRRTVDPAWAGEGHCTAFSDGFPFLVTTCDSLRTLEQAWGRPLDWRRFRPNIVIEGADLPFIEDEWQKIAVGGMELALVKPCSRCVIPDIDPATAQRDGSLLQVLVRQRRRADGKVYLGQNATMAGQLQNITLAVGDAVRVLE